MIASKPPIFLTAVVWLLLCLAVVPLTGIAYTQGESKPISSIEILRDHFDHIRYDPHTSHSGTLLNRLIGDMQGYHAQHPQDPASMALLGAMLAYQASMTGGLKGLSWAKQARQLLEAAIAIKENVFNGYALVCAGTLYALTPVWPIGFRDYERAGMLMEKAVKLNPRNIDVLFYYARYQYHTLHQTEKALSVLKGALSLPLPTQRSFAFLGRRHEVEKLLQKIQHTTQTGKTATAGRTSQLIPMGCSISDQYWPIPA